MDDIDLKTMRERLALRQKDLAEMAGVSLTMWRMAERGDRQLSVKTVNCLMGKLAYRYGTRTEREVMDQREGIVRAFWIRLARGELPRDPGGPARDRQTRPGSAPP